MAISVQITIAVYCVFVCAQIYNVEVGEDVSLCILLVDLLDIRPYHHQQFQMCDIRHHSRPTQPPARCETQDCFCS